MSDEIKSLYDLGEHFKQHLLSKKRDLGAALPGLASSFNTGGVRSWIPSGCTIMDAVLGGGLPLGRITELYSVGTSEGKSTLATHFATQTQQNGGSVIWLESEAANDWARAARLGLDLKNVLLWGPPHIEGGFEFITEMLEKIQESDNLRENPVLIVWDTISFCQTSDEAGDDMYASGMMAKPRILKRLLTKVLNTLFNCNAHLLLVSQSYTSPTRFGSTVVTPGGNAVKQLATVRIELRRIKKNTDDPTEPYILTKVTMIKNKIAPPFRQAVVRIDANYGYNDIMSMVSHFLENKVDDMMKQGGGWYKVLKGTDLEFQCRWKDLEERLRDSPEVIKVWREAIYKEWPLPVDRAVSEDGWVKPMEEEKEDGS